MLDKIIIMLLILLSTPCFSEDRISSYTDENGKTVYYSTNEKNLPAPSINKPTSNNPRNPFPSSYQRPAIEFRDLLKPNYSSNNAGNKEPSIKSTTPSSPSVNQPAYRPRLLNTEMEQLFARFTAFMGFMILIGLTFFVIWLLALIDILKNEFNGSNKIVWLLTVTFLPLLGSILYFMIGKTQKVKQQGSADEQEVYTRDYEKPKI